MASDLDSRPSVWSTAGFLIKLLASITAPLLLAGVVLWWVVEEEQGKGTVANRAATLTDLFAAALDGHVEPGDSTGGVVIADSAAIDRGIDRFVAPVFGDELSVRIVGLDGIVAYSTSAGEVSEPTGMADIAPNALRGEPTGRRGDSGEGRYPVTYSIPVTTDGSIRAVARVVVPHDEAVAATADRAIDLRYPFAVTGVVLVVVMTPLCWWSLGQVRRQFRKTRLLAMSDNLTGLANRTHFHQRLDEAIAAARRAGDRVGLVLLDLDGFKAINDRGGHAAGDRLLKRVAAALGEATRRNELACRLGGDEFAVIAPRIDDQEELVALADRLHQQVDLEVDFSDGRRLRVTASLGLAMYPDDATTTDDLLNIADVGMYRVKAARKAKLPETSRLGR